ncbi:MAG TPA: hypothetical protein VFN13_12600 [Rudaea sp.]|nr:hypothetical protein [Rudaea sp.]
MIRLVSFFVFVMIAQVAFAQGPAVNYVYSGPADEPVISLDYQGSRLKRLTTEPTLSIYADGRVVMPQIYAHMHAYSGTISQAELQSLLNLIIDKNNFFGFDNNRVRAQVDALPGPRTMLPGHLATTVIKVNANYTRKTVRYFGLGHGESVQATEQLLAIRNRLDQIMSVLRLGGQAAASGWLDLANIQLENKYPGTPQLDLDNLQSAAVHDDGSGYVRFTRVLPEQNRSVSVTISMAANGKSQAAITRDDLLPGKTVQRTSSSAHPNATQAQLTFVFSYTDPAGVGFNDATLGEARRTALDQTAALLASYFPGYTGTVHMSVNGAETTDGVLAAAGSNFNSATSCDPGFAGRGDVGIVVLGGADPATDQPDGTVTVNFEDQTWGLGDTVAANDFDFKSTLLHELMHAMGFSNSVNQDGSSSCSQAAGTPGAWTGYDEWLGDNAGPVIDASFVLDGTRWGNIVTGGAGTAGVQWQGPQGKAGNGGQPVPLYSPTVFSAGSSIAHLDDDFFTSANYLMEAATDSGLGVRTLSDFEVGMMKDIGFANTTNNPGNPDLVFANGFE